MIVQEDLLKRCEAMMKDLGARDYDVTQAATLILVEAVNDLPLCNGAKIIALLAVLAAELDKSPFPRIQFAVAVRMLREAMSNG